MPDGGFKIMDEGVHGQKKKEETAYLHTNKKKSGCYEKAKNS